MSVSDHVRDVVVITDARSRFPDQVAAMLAERGNPRVDPGIQPAATTNVRHVTADQIIGKTVSLDEASGALFVIPATHSIPDTVIDAWDVCDDLGLPRAIVICDVDAFDAATESLIEECQEALGDMVPVLAIHLPVLSDDDHPIGVIDLLSGDIIDYSIRPPRRTPAEDRHRDLVRDERSWLIEAIIAETDNESLVSDYLAGAPLDPAELVHELHATLARGRLHPILLTADEPTGFGLDQIVDIIEVGFPTAGHARP